MKGFVKKQPFGFFITIVLLLPALSMAIPQMTGTSHVIVRDIFSSAGMTGKTGVEYKIHDAIGQSSPVFYPDSSKGAENIVIVGFLPPEQQDINPPVSWIWTDYEFTPDTMVNLYWAGHDSTGGEPGTGILQFDIQYRFDGGVWVDWITTDDTAGIFGPCEMGAIYDFRIRAIDFANNQEIWTDNPDSFATTTIDYLVSLNIDVFTGGLDLDSPNYVHIAYYDTTPVIMSVDSITDSAFVWSIPGSDLAVSCLSTESNGFERWINIEDTLWNITTLTVLNPIYYHQLKAYVALIGTDMFHCPTLEHHCQCGAICSGTTLYGCFTDWIDCMGTLRFSEFTTGTPPRQTHDEREWTEIIAPINDTIWYGFAPVLIKNAFGPSDSGLVIVDGDTVPSPHQTHWEEGSYHLIEAISPQLQTATERYVFESWSDGGERRHWIEHSTEVDSYLAYFTLQYPLRIFKYPENPYGWIACDDDTSWGTSDHTFWKNPVGPYSVAVSETDVYSDSIWTFHHWDDFSFSPNRTVNIYSARELFAVYNVSNWEGILSFSISDTVWFAGNLEYNETKCMNSYESIYLQNTGDVDLNWGLWIRDDGPRWSTSFLNGIDVYNLRAQFTNSTIAPECITYHPVNDWVDYNMVWATDEIFGTEGSNVPPSGMNWAYLWFYFKSPTRSSYGTVNEIISVGILCKPVLP